MIFNNGSDASGSLGQRIKHARKARGWTLEKLASEANVSKVSVWSWEHERTKPRPETLSRVNALLDLENLAPINSEAAVGHLVSEAIADHQRRIASLVGVELDAVEIKIRFN